MLFFVVFAQCHFIYMLVIWKFSVSVFRPNKYYGNVEYGNEKVKKKLTSNTCNQIHSRTAQDERRNSREMREKIALNKAKGSSFAIPLPWPFSDLFFCPIRINVTNGSPSESIRINLMSMEFWHEVFFLGLGRSGMASSHAHMSITNHRECAAILATGFIYSDRVNAKIKQNVHQIIVAGKRANR